MTRRPTLGQILMESGVIDEHDVRRALDHQREHGGYFGQALLECGLVSEGELEWSLASQFDLPYVFPEADEIDFEAASLVSPEWALAHLTLPILKTPTTLTVVVESPIHTDAVDELRTRTELDVELALASPSKIRELVRQVYARGTAADESARTPPLTVSEALDLVEGAGATRFGVSVRGLRAIAWWDDAGTVRRRLLAGDWQGELDRALDPPLTRMTKGQSRALWSGHVTRSGVVTPVDVHYLADEYGCELLFHPGLRVSALEERFPPAPEGIRAEIRLLARAGRARFVVTTEPASLGHEILPHLPELLLDPTWRSIHVNATDQPSAAEAFSQRLPADPDTWATELEALRAFHFDVVTVDLSGGDAHWAGSALDVASVAFLLWTSRDDLRPAHDAGIRWHLRLARSADAELDWSLELLRV